jgi:hypothetical protein
MPNWFRTAMLLPWPLSRLFRVLLAMAVSRDPARIVSMAGTVGVSSVGMFGEGHSGWGLAAMGHSLSLLVGIVPREMLHLTVSFDHDIVDGGPAARFTRRLVELIESGYGLHEGEHAPQEQADSSPAFVS